jgi:hypothetical protein
LCKQALAYRASNHGYPVAHKTTYRLALVKQ